MLRVNVQLEEDQMEWLRANASARVVSVSQLIREMINFYRFRIGNFSENRKRKALEAFQYRQRDKRPLTQHHWFGLEFR